ncbi:hypothetical protein [Rariglobus hedericola]|uniref:Uncharacterized protein n=1 Tax=Rariglobus hedericola TaxID=2597822 RepID=A0A556QQP5_9BACT|nr:hypothetical protein [Rariglobus hedericola]TSJ78964.1 hypothetical protein FPL22_06585 [Rariglobus hedericola]
MQQTKRLYISLLVHEKPEVIMDQLRNFRRFAPGAVVVVHLSLGFNPPESFIAEAKALGQVYFNPESVATNKVNLLYPHLLNIKHILTLAPAGTDFISFQASNDLLVRHGLEEHLQSYDAGYFSDGYLDEKNEAVYATRVREDQPFLDLLKSLNCPIIIKSQIEGLYAQVKDLRAVLQIIETANFDMSAKRSYFAEEVMLPTLLHHVLAGRGRMGLPYILSEIAIQMKYIEIRHRLLGYNIFARAFGRILKIIGPVSISKGLVNRIRREDLGWYCFYGKSLNVRRFAVAHSFGVKRIPRDIDDRLRKYIASFN